MSNVRSIENLNNRAPEPGLHGAARGPRRQTCIALKVLFSSFFIQSSFNYHGMQNLGFAFSLLPFIRSLGGGENAAPMLNRHLQLFNTHPCMSAPIAGAVLRIEEDAAGGNEEGGAEAVNLKNALMGPYAALGDSFFWGALKPMAAVFGVITACQQASFAPLAFLLLYNPPHFWIRCRGFLEGYRRGKMGIEFVRLLDLTRITVLIRWISLAGLGLLAALADPFSAGVHGISPVLAMKLILLLLVIIFLGGMARGIDQVKILYLTFIMGCVVSL